jgi:hypothetical protein
MSLSCRIKTRVDGSISVENADGTPSQLYNEALVFTEGNESEAFRLWKTAYDTDFMNEYSRNDNDTATLDDVLKYLDTHASTGKRLSRSDKKGLTDLMESHSINSLSKLYSKLSKVFKSDGILSINPSEAIRSGLYTSEDLETLDIESIRDILERIEGELSKGDITIEPIENKPAAHINSSFKTVLGSSERVSESDIIEELLEKIEDFSNERSIEEAVNSLPYSDFVDKYNSNKSFKSKLNSQLSEFKRVPMFTIEGETLSDKNLSTYTTVKNTVLDGVDTSSTKADIDFIQGISEEVWKSNPKIVSKVLMEIEEELADINIDVIGLSSQPGRRTDVLDLLDATEKMLSNINRQTIEEFSKQKDILVPTKKQGKVLRMGASFKNLSIVRVESPLDAATMYDKFSLLKIGDNLYHKVKKGGKSDLTEYLYQKVYNGEMVIPTILDVKDPVNKIEVLKEISRYAMSRDTGIYSELNQEEIALNQLVWGHKPLAKNKVKHLDRIKSSFGYLKSKFISDFYNYTLKEKLKNSSVYRKVLSKFSISDTDINLIGRVDSIEGIKMEDELKDYISLKRDNEMDHLLEDRFEITPEDQIVVNNPQYVKPSVSRYVIDNNIVITKKTFENYIRIGESLYRRVIDRSDASAFIKIEPNTGIYNALPSTPIFDISEVESAIEKSGLASQNDLLFDEMGNVSVEATEDNLNNLRLNIEGALYSDLNIIKNYSTKDNIEDKINSCK